MTKFILMLFICSNIAGNECKTIPTVIVEFDEYHQCARHGYEAASELMNNFSVEFIEEYRSYIIFSCKENQTI